MSGFYVSLIFIGILLILFSLTCIFIDKKKGFSFNKNFDERKQELVEIINDAEQMIEELNKFSDYIVNQMDLKNEQLCRNLKAAEEKVNHLSERANAAVNVAAVIKEPVLARQIKETVSEECALIMEPVVETAGMAVNSGVLETAAAKRNPGLVVDGINCSPMRPELVVDRVNCPPMHPIKKSEKVIPINNKYSEVIRLSQEGLYGLEIAKRLNLGKGEVDLILGLRK
jgi:hypothetical protein